PAPPPPAPASPLPPLAELLPLRPVISAPQLKASAPTRSRLIRPMNPLPRDVSVQNPSSPHPAQDFCDVWPRFPTQMGPFDPSSCSLLWPGSPGNPVPADTELDWHRAVLASGATVDRYVVREPITGPGPGLLCAAFDPGLGRLVELRLFEGPLEESALTR